MFNTKLGLVHIYINGFKPKRLVYMGLVYMGLVYMGLVHI